MDVHLERLANGKRNRLLITPFNEHAVPLANTYCYAQQLPLG